MTSKKMIAICLLARPFKTSSGVRTLNTRKINMQKRNNAEGLAQLLNKAMISNKTLAMTKYGNML
jgi:hypothetical protein